MNLTKWLYTVHMAIHVHSHLLLLTTWMAMQSVASKYLFDTTDASHVLFPLGR